MNDDMFRRVLTPDELEFFYERSGIRQYDGGQTRAEADAAAYHEVISRRPPAPVPTPTQKSLFSPAVR